MKNKLVGIFKKLTMSIGVIIVMLSFYSPAQADEPICGSLERFNQTNRWQDLPGCTEERDYDNPTSAKTLLGRAKDAFKGFFEAWEQGEIDQSDSYAGGCLEFMNGADEDWNSNPELVKAKPAYEKMKRTVEQYLNWKPFVEDMFQDYMKAMMWLDKAKSGELDDAKTGLSFVKGLQKTVARVQQQNVPDTFLIPGSGEIRAATIGEIKAQINSYLQQAGSSMENAVAIDNAKWEPYTKFLSGDRLKYFNETYRIGTNVYGHGGKYLDKPNDFDTATVMCTRTSGREGLVETWKVTCYSFQGDKRIGSPRVSSGYGSTAPSSAFK
jgi:hypothetical protein